MDENILLNIEFNNDDIEDAVKNIVEGRKAIDSLIEANKKLVEQGQKNSAEYVKNQAAIKNLNKEVNDNSKLLQSNTQAVNENANSIDALKKRNSELLKERNKIDTSTIEGSKRIKELNAEYDKNSEIIAENSTLVEKQKFNIGNYQSALAGVNPALGAFAGNVGKASEASGGFASGIMGMVRASLAFIATPIGAIISAIVVGLKLLSTYLTSTQEGMDKLTSVTRPVMAVFDALLGVIQELGGKAFKVLSDAIDDPKQAIIDLGNLIKDNIINRFKAVLLIAPAIKKIFSGDFTEGVKDLGNAFIQAGTGIEDAIGKIQNVVSDLGDVIDVAIEKGKRLDELQKAIEIDELKNIVRSKELQLLIKQNKALVEDETKSYQERIDAAIRAKDEQAEALNNELSLLDKQIEKTKIQQSLNDTSREDQKELAELEAKRLELQATATEQGIEFSKKIVELQRKQLADEQSIAKNIEDLKLELLQEGIDKQKALLEKSAKEKIALLKGTEEQIAEQTLLINQNLEQDKAELDEKAAEDAIKREKERVKATEDFLAAALADELKQYQDHVQSLINTKKEELLQGTISQQEYNDEIYDIELAALIAEQELKQQFGEEDLALNAKIIDAKIAQKKFEAEETKRLEAFKLNAIQSTLGSVAGLFNENSTAFKALASAQALIQTYQSAQSVFTGMTSTIPGPIGVALGIAGAAAAVIRGLQNVARINSTQLPRLEDGGIIDISGRRHSQGGEDVVIGGRKVANVEGGEKLVVLKREASPLLRSLSQINSLAGGVDFYNNRAPKSYLADGGFVARSASSKVQNFQTISIAEDLRNARFEVSVTDIEKKQKQVNRATVTSELS